MNEKLLPDYVDSTRFAEQSLSLSGFYPLSDMQRLIEATRSKELSQGLVKAIIQFGVDEQQITFIKGQVDATLTLECQRCLASFLYPISSAFKLGIVTSLKKANALPSHYEPALIEEKELALKELIEDELILNLPLIPRHAPEDCKVTLPIRDAEWVEEEKGENPFHVLESLKHKQ